MKYLILTIFLLIFTSSFGQTNNFELINNYGKAVRIYTTHYSKDSTKNINYILLNEDRNGIPCSLKSSSNQYINDIRLDIVAVDDSTNDTIYTKSLNKEQIRKEPFIINIQNTLEILPPDFIMRPFLQIKARKNISNIYKIGDTIDLRLKNRKKIQGVIKFFDGEILTIEGLGKESVIIRRTEVNGIKTCGGLGIRNGVSIYQNCKYTKLEAVKFCLVKQVQVANSNKTIGLEWKE